jgi:hypothetical protein
MASIAERFRRLAINVEEGRFSPALRVREERQASARVDRSAAQEGDHGG